MYDAQSLGEISTMPTQQQIPLLASHQNSLSLFSKSRAHTHSPLRLLARRFRLDCDRGASSGRIQPGLIKLIPLLVRSKKVRALCGGDESRLAARRARVGFVHMLAELRRGRRFAVRQRAFLPGSEMCFTVSAFFE